MQHENKRCDAGRKLILFSLLMAHVLQAQNALSANPARGTQAAL